MTDEMFNNICIIEGEDAKKFFEEDNREFTEEEIKSLEACAKLYLRIKARSESKERKE